MKPSVRAAEMAFLSVCLPLVFAAAPAPAQSGGPAGAPQPPASRAVGALPAETVPISALFPQVAIGGGYTTVFTLMNTGSTPVTGNLILTDGGGKPMNASLASPSELPAAPLAGGLQAIGPSIPVSINPGGTQFITAGPVIADDRNVVTGWARVESTGGSLAGVATFQLVSSGKLVTIVGVLSADAVDSATIPVNDDEGAKVDTGYAVANPSTTDTITIKVVVVREDGTPAATLKPIPLPPGQQVPRFFWQDGSSRTFRGTVVLIGQDGKKFAAVALVQNQGLFTAIPVIPGRAPHIN